MYEEPGLYFDALSKKYGVDYVLVGPYERGSYAVDEQYFANRFPIFYQNESVTVYTVTQD